MPYHAASLLVFKKAHLKFCSSIATFQGSSDYSYHRMTCLLLQFNIAFIEKQVTYFPLKVELFFFYSMDLSYFFFISPDLIVLILKFKSLKIKLINFNFNQNTFFPPSSYLFIISFLSSESQLFADQSVPPFPTGSLHNCIRNCYEQLWGFR